MVFKWVSFRAESASPNNILPNNPGRKKASRKAGAPASLFGNLAWRVESGLPIPILATVVIAAGGGIAAQLMPS
jgi:hypothetical protein